MISFCDKKKIAIQTTEVNQVIRLQNCQITISNALSSSSILFLPKLPMVFSSCRFLTVFAVFSCECFLAGANVAVFLVKGNTLAVVLTRQVATWRLQKEKQIIWLFDFLTRNYRIFYVHIFKCALQHLVGDFARLLYGAVHNLFNVTSSI